jgi:hypothetical protein
LTFFLSIYIEEAAFNAVAYAYAKKHTHALVCHML